MSENHAKVSKAYSAARRSLKTRFDRLGESPASDHRGYVRHPEQNLIPGVLLGQFEEELRGGDGDELRMKFCAVHSSAALVVNTFSHFKEYPKELSVKGLPWPTEPQFERRLPVVLGRRPANLDLWLQCDSRVLAVESKFLEYLTPKASSTSKPAFAPAYFALPEVILGPWRTVCEEIQADRRRLYLDRAQLLKHILGLQRWVQAQESPETFSATLLYLFWEPTDSEVADACRKHREEVTEFVERAAVQAIKVDWSTYQDLWSEWDANPSLTAHVKNLRKRYNVSLHPSD